MRDILKAVAGLAMLATPLSAQAAPDAATVKDMACFVMMGKLAVMPADKLKGAITPEILKVATGYFGGKIAVRNPGQNLLGVVNTNRTAVNAVLTKPDPEPCLREVQTALSNPTPAPAK